jgi:hypothetical protein
MLTPSLKPIFVKPYFRPFPFKHGFTCVTIEGSKLQVPNAWELGVNARLIIHSQLTKSQSGTCFLMI